MKINKITSNTILLIFFPLSVIGQDIKCNNYTNDSTKCYLEKIYIKPQIVLDKKWQAKEINRADQIPLIADMDGDCYPEIFIQGINQINGSIPDTSRAQFYNGRDGILKRKFDCGGFDPFITPLIADVDNDGVKEIIVASDYGSYTWKGFISCYDYTGKLKWKSDEYFYNRDYDPGHATLGVADFNQDGKPEVYCLNRIFNGQTGKLLVDGGMNGIGASYYFSLTINIFLSLTVATQLDDDPSDLELAAGFTIYKVKIVNPNGKAGNQMNPINIRLNNKFLDGITAVADINGDGRLDVIVTYSARENNSILYAYTLDNGIPRIFANNYIVGNYERNGWITVADVDGNGIPNILVSKSNSIHNFEYDGTNTLALKWILRVQDTLSTTGITTYDLNGDGIPEIIYRDHFNLLIIDGSVNPPQIIDSIKCRAGTFSEYPIIADIDNTGEAQICVMCSELKDGFGLFFGHLTAFGSPDSLPGWAPARGIWNQHAYNPLFINDDLTVPAKPKNHATYENGRYNNFMQQASLLDSNGMYKVAAANLWGKINCVNYDVLTEEYTVSFNLFNYNNASTRAGSNLPVSFYNGDPEKNGKLLGIYYTQTPLEPSDSLVDLQIKFKTNQLSDLYLIVNTSRNTNGIFDPKDFIALECDYTDNFYHTTDLPQTKQVSGSICNGSQYQFFDSTLIVPGKYVHTSSNIKGCDSLITILELTVVDTVHTSQSLTACDSLRWNAKVYHESGSFVDRFQSSTGCDSVVTLNLNIRYSSDTLVRATGCRKFDFNDKVYTEGGKYFINLRNKQGCDSTIELHLSIIALDTNITKLGNTLIALDSVATYQWVDCNDHFTVIPGATQKTYTPIKGGTYAVILSNPPCNDTTKCLPIIISNTIQQNRETVYVYPNPVSDKLYIQWQNATSGEQQLMIQDLHGRSVLKKVLPKTSEEDIIEIDVSGLVGGLYFLYIQSKFDTYQVVFSKIN